MSRIMFRTVFPNRSITNYKFLQHGFLRCHSKSVKFYSSLSESKFRQNSKIGQNQIGTVGVISGSLLGPVRTLSSGSETTVTTLDSATTIVESALTEPSFQSLGLANLYPPGWLQYAMEQIHLQFDMPWWATIMIATACIRMVLFPVVIRAQKNLTARNNVMPEHLKLQHASSSPDLTRDQKFKAMAELKRFEAKHNISPMMTYIPVLCQGVTFASMFFAIRGMAECPVVSMQDDGALWFVDLTAADPFYLLPVITSISVFCHLKYSSDGIDLSSMHQTFRAILLCLPFIGLPFMCQFPAALNLYWLTTNLISIVQARTLKFPPIRKRLGINELIAWKPEQLPTLDYSHYWKEPKKTGKRNTHQIGVIDFKAKELEWQKRIEKEKSDSKNSEGK